MSAQKTITNILAQADIKINGDRPWDIKVFSDDFYTQVIRNGSLGLGESYMSGAWESAALDQTIAKMLEHRLEEKIKFTPALFMLYVQSVFKNLGAKSHAFEVGQKHYDIGNDVFERMLDARLTYTCGYWKDAQTLDAAQEAKLDLICKKLNLKEGQTVLDIGCGWGNFAQFAAEKYGARVTGITVSVEQAKLAQERCQGLPVEFIVQDYRDVEGKYDHIVSIGMFEHVGYKNYRTYCEIAQRCLKDGGLFLLHTIGSPISETHTDPWINKYIFPNGMLPSVAQIGTAIEGLFIMEDWHNFGAYYDTTLMAWFKNFDTRWEEIKEKYGDRFYRMWKFYLLSCAAGFRLRRLELWQIVLSKEGVVGGYTSVR